MIESLRAFSHRLAGVVRVRQLVDRARHRLTFIPVLYVGGAIVIVQSLLWIDRALADRALPVVLTTTVGSARAVFAAIAGGLITSITLLLSMMLITVQLASSQFSPRVVRDWLGNRTLQHTLGLVLGTAVFCLLGLRSTRNFGEQGGEIIPHATVLVAVLLGVVALVAVVRSVDHITQSLQIGTVAQRIAGETIELARRNAHLASGQGPGVVPAAHPARVERNDAMTVPEHAAPIEATHSGWLQQIDGEALLQMLPPGTTGYVVASLGGFATERSPLMWLDPPPPADHECRTQLLDAFALGDTRTMQQDISFGIVQLTDIAVRALSPGVNDPGTASDIIVHLGGVLTAIWESPPADPVRRENGRALVRREPRHEEHLELGFGPIRRYGCRDPEVMATLLRTLRTMRSEVQRRDLPGPVEPISAAIRHAVGLADRNGWTPEESRNIDELAD